MSRSQTRYNAVVLGGGPGGLVAAAGLAGLTYTHLLLQAVARALRQHPEVNSLWTEQDNRRAPLSLTRRPLSWSS